MTSFDRLFWIALRRFWAWLLAIRPARQGGSLAAGTLSQILGTIIETAPFSRPAATASEIRRLIERMLCANPLWRAPRIQGELKMLGIAISERTVSRILPDPPPSTRADFVILNARHLKRALASYFRYYHESLELIRRSTTNVRLRDRSQAPGELSQSRN